MVKVYKGWSFEWVVWSDSPQLKCLDPVTDLQLFDLGEINHKPNENMVILLALSWILNEAGTFFFWQWNDKMW